MKTGITAVFSLILGLFIGLYIVRLNAESLVQEQFHEAVQVFPPGYAATLSNMFGVMKNRASNEVRETIHLINTCGQHIRTESRLKDYYNGLFAVSLRQPVGNGDTNTVQQVLSETIRMFAQRVDEGYYEGTTLEQAANTMVQRWRNQTNSPISKTMIHSETRP